MAFDEPTQDKAIMIIPARLLRIIDQSRDTLSRVEFVEVCIDTLLKQGDVSGIAPEEVGTAKGAKVEEFVSLQEFEEFKGGIKNLQHAYIDLLLVFNLEPAARSSTEEREQLTQRVKRLLEEQ
ncbi:MAG: hypothetical protein Q7J06_02505 [Bacteroidales bacterium]|nr:hypothetical protein [Bacteroidales bacterium]